MQMSQTVKVIEDLFEIDAVYEVSNNFHGEPEVTDVFFEYVRFFPIGFRRPAACIDQKLYSLIEVEALDAFDINEAKEI